MLCQAWKQWIEQGTSEHLIAFADANDKRRAALLGVADLERLDRQMCLLTAEGSVLWGYDALVGLMGRRPAASGPAWIMGTAPIRLLGRWIYDHVARWRACSANHS